jgi:hypothetical protein
MKNTTKKLIGGLMVALVLGMANGSASATLDTGAKQPSPGTDGKAPDMTKTVKVFILLGQSNMLGMGKIAKGPEGSLEAAVKEKKKYPYLVDEAGDWAVWPGVRYVRVMVGRGAGMQVFNNEEMTVKTCKTIGPEFGIAHYVGEIADAPVMILKSCIGNRSLGWDLLPPGSKGYDFTDKDQTGNEVVYTYAGYKESPMRWVKGAEPPKVPWYAGKQYDDDTANAKHVLEDLGKYYPGAKKFEIAGFCFWQGDKDRNDAGLTSHYEQNLVRFIKQVRKDFDAPNAKFVLATLGQTRKGDQGNEGMLLEAQLAVDGNTGKYPEFKGNVATVYSNPLSHGGASNSHYNGNAETYMDIGEAMGRAMAALLKNNK